jgi:hypothetical protein
VWALYDRPNRPETLEVEPEEEVDGDEKGPYILQSEVQIAIKEMRNKKAAGDDDVPGDVLKLLGEGTLKIMTKLINTIYETGEWPQDFTAVTMITLKKKTQATKPHDQRKSALSQTQQKKKKKYLEEGLKGKLRMYLEKISLVLEEEKELGMQLG